MTTADAGPPRGPASCFPKALPRPTFELRFRMESFRRLHPYRSPMGLEECADFECDLSAVAQARAFVRRTLLAWEMPQFVDDATVLASELVTNAVLHARTPMRLIVSYDDGGPRVPVADENPRLPIVAGTPDHATSGRGLLLVDQLSSTWGV